MKYPETRY